MIRCPIELLQAEFKHSEHVRDLFVSYSETLLAQVQQTVACNAMHTTEQRICRWLLMMHDRAEGEVLPYTHEFLSHILGANRKSVTLAAQSKREPLASVSTPWQQPKRVWMRVLTITLPNRFPPKNCWPEFVLCFGGAPPSKWAVSFL